MCKATERKDDVVPQPPSPTWTVVPGAAVRLGAHTTELSDFHACLPGTLISAS